MYIYIYIYIYISTHTNTQINVFILTSTIPKTRSLRELHLVEIQYADVYLMQAICTHVYMYIYFSIYF